MDQAPLLIAAALLAGVAAAGCAVVRIVPAGHRGVVLRAGRPIRSRKSGLVVVVPGVERVTMVPLRPPPIDPLGVTAVTRDGVEIRLVVSLLWRVTDPAQATLATPDVRAATAEAVERALHHLVASLDLALLLTEREAALARLRVTALPLLAPLGVEVLDVDLLDAQVRVCPQLLRLLA